MSTITSSFYLLPLALVNNWNGFLNPLHALWANATAVLSVFFSKKIHNALLLNVHNCKDDKRRKGKTS